MARHDPDATRDAILAEMSRAALVIGQMLYDRREQAPATWEQWAAANLPFDPAVTRRMLAIYVAHRSRATDQLPAPWTAFVV